MRLGATCNYAGFLFQSQMLHDKVQNGNSANSPSSQTGPPWYQVIVLCPDPFQHETNQVTINRRPSKDSIHGRMVKLSMSCIKITQYIWWKSTEMLHTKKLIYSKICGSLLLGTTWTWALAVFNTLKVWATVAIGWRRGGGGEWARCAQCGSNNIIDMFSCLQTECASQLGDSRATLA